MRPLLAIAIFAAGMLALDATADADAARKSKRSAKQQHSYQQKIDWACEERARHEDPSGQFAALRPGPQHQHSVKAHGRQAGLDLTPAGSCRGS
jgi:hypothetical protein